MTFQIGSKIPPPRKEGVYDTVYENFGDDHKYINNVEEMPRTMPDGMDD